MQIFVINLGRRPDRLMAMSAQLNALGLPFRRIEAVDAQTADDGEVNARFTDNGPIGTLPKGDKCCFLSHIQAWRTFLAGEEPYGVVLEDDIMLDRAAQKLLGSADWIPPGIRLLKVEHYGPQGQHVLLGEPLAIGEGRTASRIYSKYTGAGAYIIRRDAAQLLLDHREKWSVSVDHLLFNANVSPLTDRLEPHQLLPVIARQSADVGGVTDIGPWRATHRKLTPAYIRRELVRAFYDVRLLPQQFGRVLRHEVTFVPIRSDGMSPVVLAPGTDG
ncbi:MAG: glycosyltransferase family 25 protein [Alphaproteobacteria bacterium]|nr:glycosyltransferase family 25 protein [Alphaproteobacteria bacterium]